MTTVSTIRSLLATLLLGACMGAGAVNGDAATTTSTSTSTSSSAASTTTSTMATTTTTLNDEEVVDALKGFINDPAFESKVEVILEMTAGGETIVGQGGGEVDGDDSHFYVDVAGVRVESLMINDVSYSRTNDGPWVSDEAVLSPFAEPGEEPQVGAEDLAFATELRTFPSLEHQGVEQRAGLVLHRIGLPEGESISPEILGLDPDDPVAISVIVLATSTGEPFQLEYEITDRRDPELVGSLTLKLRFVESDGPIVVSEPVTSWLRYTSPDYGYEIGFPRNWDVIQDRDEWIADYFVSLGVDELDVYPQLVDPPGPVSLNSWLKTFRQFGIETWSCTYGAGGEMESLGFPARTLDFDCETETALDQPGIHIVTQVSLESVFEFIYFLDPDSQARSRELLDDFLSTFTYGG